MLIVTMWKCKACPFFNAQSYYELIMWCLGIKLFKILNLMYYVGKIPKTD